MINQDIDRAAEKAGIASSFSAIDGTQQFTSIETKVSLLAAMKDMPLYPLPDDHRPVRDAYIFRLGEAYQIQLDKLQKIIWHVKTEDNKDYQGTLEESSQIVLPHELPMGYHQLTLEIDNQHWHTQIIIVPARCFEPQILLDQQKIWGISVQLYTIRSEHNWGMGDFSDLHRLIEQISQRGGSFIGLNPIHALYPAHPHSASPYSPSSRKWLNVLYIDVNNVHEFKECEQAQEWWHSELTQEKLNYARHTEWIDYDVVNSLKMQGLRLAFNYFKQQDNNGERQQEFQQFVNKYGESLRLQATFDALHLSLNSDDENHWGWTVWPEQFQDSNKEAVKQFSENNQNDIMFFSWLQWLAHLQLASCHMQCQKHQMAIGLYRDLAVGVSEGSAEVWADKELYCPAASIGAPPDPLGPLGQVWGLPPMNPHMMQARGYQPFIDLLRANMSYCGALRIDHVMALLRLWWIPYGQPPEKGAYVHYPVDDLLGILALESQRHQCMIIGEDLGTVPPEITEKLQSNGVYSYRVLYFQHGGNNDFFLPKDYPRQAMATITTHDLPTLRSFWLSNDLTLGSELKLYPDRYKLYSLYNDRIATKRGLLHALSYAGYSLDEDENITITLPMSDELSLAVLRYMASSHSLLLGLQLEDLLGMLLPVNIPGTSDQYANWRRKLSQPLNDIFTNNEINHLLEEVNQIRRALNL